MTAFLLLPFAAAIFSVVLAVASLLRRKPRPATWCFFAGMLALALDSLFTGLGLRVTDVQALIDWLTASFIIESTVPVVWLGFSLDLLARRLSRVAPSLEAPAFRHRPTTRRGLRLPRTAVSVDAGGHDRRSAA